MSKTKDKKHGHAIHRGTVGDITPGTAPEIAERMAACGTGTSIFDPVLCELCYRWFCPPGGRVLDPFAGGSVRGIVAGKLGFRYSGMDLSERQIAANQEQAAEIFAEKKPKEVIPTWHVGDSARELENIAGAKDKFDFVFSCPPYFDLEVYSDKKADLSAMSFGHFEAAYRQVIRAAVNLLKLDRFACFVIGDVRDSFGFYRNLPGLTVAAFDEAGAHLSNEAVLVTVCGSLPIRVGHQFSSYRKLGKTHQNVLVFFKGNIKAVKDWPLPEFGEPESGQPQSPSSPGTDAPAETEPRLVPGVDETPECPARQETARSRTAP